MRRFAMPAFVLAGLLTLPAPAARAGTLCVFVVVQTAQGQTALPPVCVDEPLAPIVCREQNVDLEGDAFVTVLICVA